MGPPWDEWAGEGVGKESFGVGEGPLPFLVSPRDRVSNGLGSRVGIRTTHRCTHHHYGRARAEGAVQRRRGEGGGDLPLGKGLGVFSDLGGGQVAAPYYVTILHWSSFHRSCAAERLFGIRMVRRWLYWAGVIVCLAGLGVLGLVGFSF